MRRAAALVLLAAAPAIADTPPWEKAAWLWTEEERLAARFIIGSAERRSRVPRPRGQTVALDYVDGGRTPELLLTHELFADLMRQAFPRERGPEKWTAKAFERAGRLYLIPDLEQILGRQARVLRRLPLTAGQHEECRAFSDALSATRAELGSRYPEFMRFLYVEVAPGVTVQRWSGRDNAWEPVVKWEARGCRTRPPIPTPSWDP